ncbi:hypothetical protein VE01_06431 [Pseudogymnoascus verrucosus]|uniref:C2H2-type domain-containing protein n=1 Tax=Pseudogymnoascus verrucosus TaxID=342668 RepID=A0A1B8GIV6_9PEZI|nr:uncharacterized protein VE01_06431 [Pseudogymnoascus verrucosus]OBT95745.1 hypothetical protein VE01_06431 [Pseudogymnoascus verrucosus]
MSASEAHVATSSCLEAFGALRSHLQAAKPEFAAQVPDADIEDEFGRFRLWAANIGALSRGHSSLDYRLRDAPLVLEGALKLLNELQQELHQMCLVLSGARLPYEAQISSRAGHVDDSDTSSLSSDSESSSDSSSDSDDEKLAPSELRRRVSALSNINDNLYRLSRSIRAPASHSRSLKALSYKLIDKETGVDVVQQFAPVDLAFTKDLFSQLRRNAQDQYANCPTLDDGDLAMIKRLAQGITRRRQQFLYWKHHRKKLGFHAEKEILKIPKPAPTVHLKGDEMRESVAGPRASLPVIGKAQTESSRPKTTLTETTATLFITPANVPDGNQSVTSYATTARGLDGSRIEFPKLPKDIKKGKDFECPYCLMICPPHYQMPRAWRTHLLRDLRPYMCTHKHCQQPDELFATKQEWLNHERTHQKAWQCPEHASTHFLTQDDLKRHLLAENHESLQRMGLDDLLAICETVRPDSRTICPICFVDAGSSYGLENHLANHLERFAAFALPRDVEGNENEESPENSNISDHAIARSDQSEVSDISYAFASEDKKAEIETLVKMTQGISSTVFSDAYFPGVDKLHRQMISIVNLPTEILDKLNVDLQFKAVFKTIPRLLTELKEFVASDDGDDFQECASELIFQMERLDSILQEYAVDFALDSSHPRLGMDAGFSNQGLEDGRERNQADGELSPSRDSSPDSVVNRTGPRLSTMDLDRSRTSDSAEEATSPIRDSSPDSIVNRTSSILSTMDLNKFETSKPAEDGVSPTRDSAPFLIATLTSLLTKAQPIQQRLQDIATEGKVKSNALVILKRIFPGICVSITRLIAMLREGVLDPSIVLFIEQIDTRCQRLFEDASTFLDRYKKSTRLGLVSQKTLGWGSKKQYREDKLRLVSSGQSVEEEINHTLELHARGRLRKNGRDQDELISPLSIESHTLTADNARSSSGLSSDDEQEQRPESPKNSQDTNNIQDIGLEDGSKVGHETSELSKLIASQRDSADTTRYTPINGPVIIDERPIKGILKTGRNKFPEDPSPTREGVAFLRDELNDGMYVRPSRAEGAPPPDARWTKINRLLVNPEALDDGRERYEARDDFVIVLRVLSKEEIQAYADATAKIRAARGVEDDARDERRIKRIPPPSPEPEEDVSDGDDEGNNSEFERSYKRKLAQLRQTQQESHDLQKEKIPGDARGTKIDPLILSPEAITPASEPFEERGGFSPRVGSLKSAQLLPHGFMGALEKRMTGVLTMKERLPGYSDPAVKRSFAEAYTAFTEAAFRRRMEKDRRVEDLVLIFYSNAVKSLQKGKLQGDDSWKNLLYPHVALFLRLLSSTMKDHGYDKDRPELMSRLARAEKKLLTDDQSWSSIMNFLHEDEVEVGSSAALLASRADIMEEGGDVRERREGKGAPMLEQPRIPTRHEINLEQTLAFIELLKVVADGIQQKWDALHSFIDPPEAFLEEAKRLESVLGFLKTSEVKEHELDDATLKALKQRLISCLEIARKVDKILKEEEPTIDEDGKLSRPRNMVVPRFKNRLPAEEFVQGVIRDVRFISTNMHVGFIAKEQPANITDAIKEMGGTPLPNPEPHTIAGSSTEDRKKDEADDERGWRVPDIGLYKADNITMREPRDEDEPGTEDVPGDPLRPSSATSSVFDDDVVLNPHTIPRSSMDTSPATERNTNASHQSAKIDNKRLPRNNYSARPPLSSSAYFNPHSSRTTSTAPITTTTFPCTFAFAGCSSVFTLKDYWKRHVANNHMGFVYWKCPLKPCPRPLFDTDDLLEGHLKWVHEVPGDHVAALAKRGEQPGRSLIQEIRCPAPGCIEEWNWMGSVAWDERMEHVAKHWDAVAKGEEEGGWTEEGGGLLEWAIKEGAVRELGGELFYEAGMPFKPRDNSIDEEKPTYDDAPGPSASSITPSHRNNVVLDPSTVPQNMGHTSHDDVKKRVDDDGAEARRKTYEAWSKMQDRKATVARDLEAESKGEEAQNPNDGKKPVDDSGFEVPPPTTDPTTHRTTNHGEAKASVRFAPEHEAESPRPPSAKSMTSDDDSDADSLDIDTGLVEYLASPQRPEFIGSGLNYDALETTHRDEGRKPMDDADVEARLEADDALNRRSLARASAKLDVAIAESRLRDAALVNQLENQNSPIDDTLLKAKNTAARRALARAKAKLEAVVAENQQWDAARAAKQLESQTSPHDHTTMHDVGPAPSSPPVPSRSPLDPDNDRSDVSTIEFGTSSTPSDRDDEDKDDGSPDQSIRPETLSFLDAMHSLVQETKHQNEVEKPTDRDVTVINHNSRLFDASEPRSGESRETKGLVRSMSERLSSHVSRPRKIRVTQESTPRNYEWNPISDSTIDTPPQTTNPTTRPTLPRPEPRIGDRLAAARRAAAKRPISGTDAPRHRTEHDVAPGPSPFDTPDPPSPVPLWDPEATPDHDDDEVPSHPPYPGLGPQIPIDASITLDEIETWDLPPAGLKLASPFSRTLDDEDAPATSPPAVSEAEEDSEDEGPMDEKKISRLKRVFSMRNWTTEKGRGEQKGKGKEKDMEDDEGGGGSRSRRRRSGLGFN